MCLTDPTSVAVLAVVRRLQTAERSKKIFDVWPMPSPFSSNLLYRNRIILPEQLYVLSRVTVKRAKSKLAHSCAAQVIISVCNLSGIFLLAVCGKFGR